MSNGCANAVYKANNLFLYDLKNSEGKRGARHAMNHVSSFYIMERV